MTDPWGADQPPAGVGVLEPLPPRLARLAQVQASGVALTIEDPSAEHFPVAAELPEVQALMGQGWAPLHPAPLYSLLPAAWPPEHRTWVPDRLPRVGMGRTTDGYWGTIVALDHDDLLDDLEDDFAAEQARDAGLPPPPTGRIWLLRSPWPSLPVSVVRDIIWAVVEADGRPDEIHQMYRAAGDVLTWDEDRALAACSAETRDLLDKWAAAGRVGEAAGAVVEAGLTPTALADAIGRTGLDEAILMAWLTQLNADAEIDLESAVGVITGWREAGLPGDPPPGASRFADRDLNELRRWIDAGFDLYAAARLELAGLDTAIQWRDAGFDPAETYRLLRADPALTTDEAHAFDGLPADNRHLWVHFGFTAADAAAWAGAGLTAHQARLWRACSKQPADVQDGQRIPPHLIEGRRYTGFGHGADGELHAAEWEELPDPPETRGRRARRARGDDDPWINSN